MVLPLLLCVCHSLRGLVQAFVDKLWAGRVDVNAEVGEVVVLGVSQQVSLVVHLLELVGELALPEGEEFVIRHDGFRGSGCHISGAYFAKLYIKRIKKQGKMLV